MQRGLHVTPADRQRDADQERGLLSRIQEYRSGFSGRDPSTPAAFWDGATYRLTFPDGSTLQVAPPADPVVPIPVRLAPPAYPAYGYPPPFAPVPQYPQVPQYPSAPQYPPAQQYPYGPQR
jgi:hypothetical protein